MLGQGGVEIAAQAVALPIDDPLFEEAVDGPVAAVLDHRLGGRDALEEVEQLGEWVVLPGVVATVVDDVEADLKGLRVDAVEREDLRRVDDRRVQTGFLALVEVDRVEDVPSCGGQAEADVGQAEDRRCSGYLGLDGPDAIQGGDPIPPGLLHAGAKGEGQGIEQQVLRCHPVAVDGQIGDGLRRFQLALRRSGLACGVDAGAHHRGAVLPGQGQEAVEAGTRLVAVLEVDGVEDGLAGNAAESQLRFG